MISPPRVSVLIITYNQERFIEQAVRSALMQETADDYEIVIGEDCSTDRTRDILLRLDVEHPGRLRLLPRETNLGMMRNFRETYAACRGEYVALLEGDDYWTDPHKLRRQIEALQKHPDWSGCFHPVRHVNQFGFDVNWVHPRLSPPEVTLRDLCEENLIQTCSLVFRRERMPTISPWLTSLNLGDWPLFILLAETGPLGFLPEAMACYRRHPHGVWFEHDRVFHLQSIMTMFAELDRNTGGRHAAEIRKGRDRVLADFFRELDGFRKSWSNRLWRACVAPFHLAIGYVKSKTRSWVGSRGRASSGADSTSKG